MAPQATLLQRKAQLQSEACLVTHRPAHTIASPVDSDYAERREAGPTPNKEMK